MSLSGCRPARRQSRPRASGEDAQTNLATALRRRPRYQLRNVLQTHSAGTQEKAHIRGAGREKRRSPRTAGPTNRYQRGTRSASQSTKSRSVQAGFSLSRHRKFECPSAWKERISRAKQTLNSRSATAAFFPLWRAPPSHRAGCGERSQRRCVYPPCR